MANPSSPSVKFTALDDPIITNTEKGIKNHPRLIIKFLKKNKEKILASFRDKQFIENIVLLD